MKNSVILPAALQLCVDDIGWFRGSDDRYAGKPSRTGMPRTHVAEDYIILNEIGKAINQKIVAPFVIVLVNIVVFVFDFVKKDILVNLSYPHHTIV